MPKKSQINEYSVLKCIIDSRRACIDPCNLILLEQTHQLTEWGSIASGPLATDIITFANGTKLQLFPTSEATLRHQHMNGTRRNLGDFRQCSPCTCCDRTRRWCLPTVCCYNIRCGIPGLPFGMCSFIPISCTCYGCRD